MKESHKVKIRKFVWRYDEIGWLVGVLFEGHYESGPVSFLFKKSTPN